MDREQFYSLVFKRGFITEISRFVAEVASPPMNATDLAFLPPLR